MLIDTDMQADQSEAAHIPVGVMANDPSGLPVCWSSQVSNEHMFSCSIPVIHFNKYIVHIKQD